jgi:serine/threonine protein kinase
MPTTTYPQRQSLSPQEMLRRLGPYQIESVLGQGAAAVVYQAVRLGATPMALKVLTQSAAAEPKLRQAFQREARIMLRLNHPHIIRCIEAGQLDGYYFIAMNYLEGETLDALLTRSVKLGETPAIDIARQMADALDHLHRLGIVHRDVKPANILLDRNGRAFLFDFGTALDLNQDTPIPGEIYGTPAFLSPEQARGDGRIDGRADLYSLGIVLYRMVAGRKPFYGSRNEVLEAHQLLAPPRPSEFVYLSDELEGVILKAIAKEPSQRYQTGAEMAAALDFARLSPSPVRSEFPQRILHWLRSAVGANE